MGPFEDMVESQQLAEVQLDNVKADLSRTIRVPSGYRLKYGGWQSRGAGDTLAYNWYTLSDPKGEVARLSDSAFGKGRIAVQLNPIRKRFPGRINTAEIRQGVGSDITPRGEGSLQSMVDIAVEAVERVKAYSAD